MRESLMEIARLHPEYGYRHTTSELVEQDFVVNHKVVQRLHRHWHLSVIKRVRPPKPNPIRKLLKEAGSKNGGHIQSLQSVSYNCVESEKSNRTKGKLQDVIYYLMARVLDSMPEFQRVETW